MKLKFLLCCLFVFTSQCVFTQTYVINNTVFPVPNAVDLGLPSGAKWSNMNIGASSENEVGGYYGWADPTGELTADDYNWRSCELDGKWNSPLFGGTQPPFDISGTELDIVYNKLGGKWLMPSFDDFRELNENCTFTEESGSIRVTGPNGNSILLPISGFWGYTGHSFSNGVETLPSYQQTMTKYSCFWASTRHSFDEEYDASNGYPAADYFGADENGFYGAYRGLCDSWYRNGMIPVRAIYKDETKVYHITYLIDGEVYKSYTYNLGSIINPEAEPTKEGYVFSGWSEIPETMPGEDIVITGTFTEDTSKGGEGDDDTEEDVDTGEDVINISVAGQTTWCSKYDLDFTEFENVKVYTAGGYDRETGVIWLMRVKKVPAGEGILLIGDAGEYKVPHKSTTAYYMNMLVGTLKAKTINETDGEYTNYYLSNGAFGVGFYKVDGSIEIKANRAYLPLLKNTVSGSRGFIGLGFDDDSDGTTGIHETRFRGEEDVWYNLQGQRVERPGKGLYIRNGRMVVIRSTTK